MTETHRQHALAAWFAEREGLAPQAVDIRAVAGDASFRRYFRAACANGDSVILCDAPPATEKNREFVTIARAFAGAGVRVPQVLHADIGRGFLVLEDLGDRTLLPELREGNVDGHYAAALAMLERLARLDSSGLGLLPYDAAHLQREMDLFPEWFCEGLVGLNVDSEARVHFERLSACLIERAQQQAQVVVHRDFHARNLMVLDSGELATIDFQDAVIGPVTYDPVSLLRDCYLRWPAGDVRLWALQHREGLLDLAVPVPSADEFLVDFDWMGLQRHIKVLGIFARLKLRDGKGGYLGDLPRVMGYVREVLALYPGEPALAGFAAWFEAEVVPRAEAQPWYAPVPEMASPRGAGDGP
ncbi:MAG: phosphotransferase [Halieaceae bacterium]|jgi:aminoglycoside/choline kinase family phosphotransferase|nr:phosphotransferase [Halieaceae bacterium]